MQKTFSRQLIFISLLSLLSIIFIKELHWLLLFIDKAHDTLTDLLALVFSGKYIGLLIRGMLSLTLIPLLVSGVVNGIFWLVKRTSLPYRYEIMWVVWLMLATSLALNA